MGELCDVLSSTEITAMKLDVKHKHDVLHRNTPPRTGYLGNRNVQQSIRCVESTGFQKHTGLS